MTKSNVRSLSVHRNNLEQRRRKRSAERFREATRVHLKHSQPVGFAIVTWNEDGSYLANWDSGDSMPSAVVPEFAKAALQTFMLREIVKE